MRKNLTRTPLRQETRQKTLKPYEAA